MKNNECLLSIVIPFFNEKENLIPLWNELNKNLENLDCKVEIIFVDDGSNDGSLEVIENLHRKDKRIKLIRLSRNFGHQAALMAGIASAKGDAVITIDADLQQPPHLIPKMVEKWKEGFDVVNTIRIKTKGVSPLKEGFSKIFYKVFSALSEIEIKPGSADFRLIDRKVVDELKALPEYHKFIRGLVKWLGFKQTDIEYEADERLSGKSKYSFFKMLKLAIDGITSFSSIPLRIAAILGFLVTFLSFLYLIYAFIQWLKGDVKPGWPSLIATILLIGGIELIALGIIGQYLSRVYNEVKKRPIYIVQERKYFD